MGLIVFPRGKIVRCAATVAVVTGLLGAARDGAHATISWLTGTALQKQLAQPEDFTWSGTPLRKALRNLSRMRRVAVLIDRRVDPGQKVELVCDNMPLEAAFAEIARRRHLGLCSFGPVVYFGPVEYTARLRTLGTLRREEARRLSGAIRRKLLAAKRLQWKDFATPRELLDQLSRQSGIEISGAELVPHDLWAGAELPPLPLVDRLTLIVGQFDLTFNISSDGKTLTLVPIPKDPIPKDVVPVLRDWPKSTGRHTDQPARAGLDQKRFTVREAKGPVGELIGQLAGRLKLEVRIDREALEKSGVSLEQLVTFSVKDATVDELFRAALTPARLTFERNGNVLEIRPAH